MGPDISPASNVDINSTPSTQPTNGANPINSDDQTPASQQAPVTPSSPATTPSTPSTPTAPQDTQGSQSALPSAIKSPTQSAPVSSTPAPSAPPQNPAVQKASLFHQIAETLSGGPRYKDSVDVNTGQTTRTKVPLTGSQIGLAIALEAISGGLAGLGAKGPNATGQAAGLGLKEGQQIEAQRKQKQQEEEQRANADFARHYQVVDTNMRLWQNAQTVGRQDLATNETYVDQFKPLADQIQKDHPEIVKGLISESDFSKYHVTKDSAIPVSVVKRLDPKTGQQVVNSFGVPQWDVQYLVIDPHFKGDGFLSDADRAEAAKFRLPGFADSDGKPSSLPQSLPMKLNMALNYKSRIAALRLADQDIKDYYGSLNKSVENGNVPMTMPVMRDQATQAIVDDAANRYQVPQALARAVAMQESGGQANIVSPKGAMGVMQLMPDTVKQFNVADPFNPSQNIDAGVHYLSQLYKKYNGDTKLVLAAYNAGPGRVTDSVPNIPETQNYVNSISKAIGLDNPQGPQAGEKNAYEPVDLVAEVKKDPTLVDAIQKFQPLLNATGQNYAKAIGELGAKDPQAAGKILALYGGTSLVNHYDQSKLDAEDAAKKRAENTELLNRQAADRAAKEAENEQAYMDDAKAIAGDPNDPGSGDMMALDKLISQRTADRPKVYALAKKINPNFNPANAELKLDTWKDFATDQGKSSQQIKSFNTLFDHIGGALDSSKNLHNTNYGQAINEPINKFKKDYAGDPNLTGMIAAIEPVKSEFMTFLNNNHALTEHDKNVGDDILNWNMSPAQLEENLKKFAETAAYRLKENNNQFKRVFGTNVPGLVSDDALKTIKQIPTVADIIGDMDTGGTFLGSSDGRGRLGQTVNQAIGRTPQPQFKYKTADGKMGWNGSVWVNIQSQPRQQGQ